VFKDVPSCVWYFASSTTSGKYIHPSGVCWCWCACNVYTAWNQFKHHNIKTLTEGVKWVSNWSLKGDFYEVEWVFTSCATCEWRYCQATRGTRHATFCWCGQSFNNNVESELQDTVSSAKLQWVSKAQCSFLSFVRRRGISTVFLLCTMLNIYCKCNEILSTLSNDFLLFS